eukprot:7297374-Pyramimonas_sp.AAC.1
MLSTLTRLAPTGGRARGRPAGAGTGLERGSAAAGGHEGARAGNPGHQLWLRLPQGAAAAARARPRHGHHLRRGALKVVKVGRQTISKDRTPSATRLGSSRSNRWWFGGTNN